MRPVKKCICIANSLRGGNEGLVAGAKTQSSIYRGGDDVRGSEDGEEVRTEEGTKVGRI